MKHKGVFSRHQKEPKDWLTVQDLSTSRESPWRCCVLLVFNVLELKHQLSLIHLNMPFLNGGVFFVLRSHLWRQQRAVWSSIREPSVSSTSAWSDRAHFIFSAGKRASIENRPIVLWSKHAVVNVNRVDQKEANANALQKSEQLRHYLYVIKIIE